MTDLRITHIGGLCRLMRPRTAIPLHYEGWQHFREGRDAVERRLADAPADIRGNFRWLTLGTPTHVDVRPAA
ncbi:hypothetical protein OG216_36140 [Streptomycetaceae bacterium NBC_01309]